MAQEPHQGSGEADCMSSHMGHKSAMNVPDFLPAMQKALYARLSQKHQRDGDSVSSQGQRAMSKDEGTGDFTGVLNVEVEGTLAGLSLLTEVAIGFPVTVTGDGQVPSQITFPAVFTCHPSQFVLGFQYMLRSCIPDPRRKICGYFWDIICTFRRFCDKADNYILKS